MNSFKRLIISVKSQIDQVTEGLENHEALAEAAIQEVELLRKQNCQHLYRLGKSKAREQTLIDRLEEEVDRWRERAIRIRARDENKALECVKRMKETENRIKQHRRALEKITRQHEQALQDLSCIDSKIDSLRNRKLLLSARQTHGQASSVMRSLADDEDELEAIFDRWEETVAVSECGRLDVVPPEPDLDEEFRREEEQAELKSMLDDLTRDPDLDEEA